MPFSFFFPVTQILIFAVLVAQSGIRFCQILVAGQVVSRFGLSIEMIILSPVYLFRFIVLDATSAFVLIGVVEVACPIAVYEMTAPSREVIFSLVSRDAKYRSKNFMDTFVFRGCDALAAFMQLKQLIVPLPAASRVMVPVTLICLVVGWTLGQQPNSQNDISPKPESTIWLVVCESAQVRTSSTGSCYPNNR